MAATEHLGNVVEVDFSRRVEEMTLGELADEIDAGLDEAASTIRGIREDYLAGQRQRDWLRRQLDLEREQRRRVEKELLALRHTIQPVEAAVHAALVAVYDGEPVSAAAVAGRMFETPSHSTLIRVGQTLARLAAKGLVAKTASDYDRRVTCRWAPTSAPILDTQQAGGDPR